MISPDHEHLKSLILSGLIGREMLTYALRTYVIIGVFKSPKAAAQQRRSRSHFLLASRRKCLDEIGESGKLSYFYSAGFVCFFFRTVRTCFLLTLSLAPALRRIYALSVAGLGCFMSRRCCRTDPVGRHFGNSAPAAGKGKESLAPPCRAPENARG